MKLPKKIRIMDRDFDVNYFDKVSEVDSYGERPLNGLYHPQKSEIRVYKGENKTGIAHTIFHEIVHGICNALSMDELYDDEKFVDKMAMAISCLIRDNDFSWIKENDLDLSEKEIKDLKRVTKNTMKKVPTLTDLRNIKTQKRDVPKA